MLILGVDPSLTSTGVALLCTETEDERDMWSVTTVRSKAVPATVEDQSRATMVRMQRIGWDLADWAHMMLKPDDAPDLVVLEAPAFSKNNGMAHERAGLWWRLYGELSDYRVRILVVKPNLRAKYATGRGTAGKDEVMLAASRRYPDAAISNNNESDAVVLAAMGARLHGCAVDTMPAAHLAALRTLA